MHLRISEIGNYDVHVQTETGRVSIGCTTLTVEEWLKQGEEIGRNQGLNFSEILHYKHALEFVQAALQPRPASAKKSAKKSENKLAKKKAAKQVKHVTKKAVTKKAVTKKRK